MPCGIAGVVTGEISGSGDRAGREQNDAGSLRVGGETAAPARHNVAVERGGDRGPAAQENGAALEDELVGGVAHLSGGVKIATDQGYISDEIVRGVGEIDASAAAGSGDVAAMADDQPAFGGKVAGDHGGEIVVFRARGIDVRHGVAVCGGAKGDGIGRITRHADIDPTARSALVAVDDLDLMSFRLM